MIPEKYRPSPSTIELHSRQVASDEQALSGVLDAVRRNRLLLLASIVFCAGLGIAYTLHTTPTFEATSVVRFEAEHVDLPQLVQLPYTENLIVTEMEVLKGHSAAVAVVDSLGFRARLVAPRRVRVSQLFKTLVVPASVDTQTLVFRARENGTFAVTRPDSAATIGIAQAGDTSRIGGVLIELTPDAKKVPELRLHIDDRESAVTAFASSLELARPTREADLIAISVRNSDPVRAAAAANLMATDLIRERNRARSGRNESVVSFLKQQDDSLGHQLKAAEESLRSYQQQEHVIDVPEQASAEVTRLAKLQADLAGVRAERDAFASLVTQLKNDTAKRTIGTQSIARRLMGFPTLLSNQSASTLLGALAQVETERSHLLIHRTPDDSDVQVLTARIHEMEAQLQGIAESYLQSLSDQVTSLDGESQKFSTQLDALPEKELQTARRERDAKVLNDLWVLVQTRLKEAEMTGAGGDPTVRVADVAIAPSAPVRPRPMINLALSIILGALVGVTAVLALDYSDRSVRSRADALAAVGLPVLGAFPRLRLDRSARAAALQPVVGNLEILMPRSSSAIDPERRRRARGIASLLVTRPEVSPSYVESLNQLFVNLALSHHEKPLKKVVFTSALPGEGKSLSAINYALVGASRGLRVLLIDADLRCGVVSAVLGIKQTPGFTEVLSGKATFAEAAHHCTPGEHRSLVVLPSGSLPKVPGRILTIDRVRAVLNTWAPEFDLIVIDTPPINLLADAALLASASDAVMLVVRVGHTQIDDLRYAMEQLDSTGAPVIGTLLNDIDLRKNSRDDESYRYLAEAARYNATST